MTIRIDARALDALALEALRLHGRQVTTVVRNSIALSHPEIRGLKTAQVRRRLFSLERRGQVERRPTAYETMLGWALRAEPAPIAEAAAP